MALDTMYAGKVNSPATTLDGGINDSVTTINVVDGTVLPDAPNLAVIGTGEDAETILYETKNGNELSDVTRGFQGVAKAWDSGTSVARLFTAYDYDTLRTNINDLNTNKLDKVIDDTTPELGGNLDSKDKNITGIGRASFTQELDNGLKTTDFSIDFATDQKQKVTLTANTITLTLDTTSVGVANYLLKIVNGGLATLTWASESGSIYWPGGTEPTLTSSGTDIVAFYFDGTNWYAQASLDFSVPA